MAFAASGSSAVERLSNWAGTFSDSHLAGTGPVALPPLGATYSATGTSAIWARARSNRANP